MKLAVLGESETDEVVVRVLVEAICDQATEEIAGPPLRSRGWPSIKNVLPTVIKHLHYRTDAETLVVLVDSNHSTIHSTEHSVPSENAECRLCALRQIAGQTTLHLAPRPMGEPLKIAIGLPVPSLEAWLRCGVDSNVSETTWRQGREARRDPYSKIQLKRDVYGSDRAPIEKMKEIACAEAKRLSENIQQLEARFPGGFGTLAQTIRGW